MLSCLHYFPHVATTSFEKQKALSNLLSIEQEQEDEQYTLNRK